jgi:hypothetical protein
MKKQKILSILEKYNLDKLVDKARWRIENEILYINFLFPNKTLVGFLETPFPSFDDMKMGVYFTNQLISLINIMGEELDINIVKNKLFIRDETYDISYSLADLAIIEQIEKVNEPYNCIANIDLTQNKDFIKNLIKANKALSDNTRLSITFREENNKKIAKFTLGENGTYTNKILLTLETNYNPHVYIDLDFNSDLVKIILSNNLKADKINMFIWEEGLMKIEIEEGDIKSKYYLTALE